MKKILINILSFLITIIIVSSFNCSTISKENKNTYISYKNDSISKDWKKYSNSVYGISFFYPDSWNINNESSAINLKGEVMSNMLFISDPNNQSSLFIEYHVPPYGKGLYKIVKDQYDISSFDKKKNKVSNQEALETSYVMSKDIKGNIYNPALVIIQMDFLDKKGDGLYHLRFQTIETNKKIEIEKFYKLLSTINLIEISVSK